MIVEPRVVAYINSLDSGNSDICNLIEKEALNDNVPIIRKEMGNLLKVLIALKQPERILEVGTAVGVKICRKTAILQQLKIMTKEYR